MFFADVLCNSDLKTVMFSRGLTVASIGRTRHKMNDQR